jgi:hypothetical protein
MNAVAQRIVKRDCNGAYYALPEESVDRFVDLDEAIQNAEFMSDEFWSATEALSEEFGKFREKE